MDDEFDFQAFAQDTSTVPVPKKKKRSRKRVTSLPRIDKLSLDNDIFKPEDQVAVDTMLATLREGTSIKAVFVRTQTDILTDTTNYKKTFLQLYAKLGNRPEKLEELIAWIDNISLSGRAVDGCLFRHRSSDDVAYVRRGTLTEGLPPLPNDTICIPNNTALIIFPADNAIDEQGADFEEDLQPLLDQVINGGRQYYLPSTTADLSECDEDDVFRISIDFEVRKMTRKYGRQGFDSFRRGLLFRWNNHTISVGRLHLFWWIRQLGLAPFIIAKQKTLMKKKVQKESTGTPERDVREQSRKRSVCDDAIVENVAILSKVTKKYKR